jgi:hypothetical protein
MKSLVAQLRETQALFAASTIHSGIASSSLASAQTESPHLKAEIARLRGALKEEKREVRRREKELQLERVKEKEARTRLGRYELELKVRDARASGRKEGREEVHSLPHLPVRYPR